MTFSFNSRPVVPLKGGTSQELVKSSINLWESARITACDKKRKAAPRDLQGTMLSIATRTFIYKQFPPGFESINKKKWSPGILAKEIKPLKARRQRDL